MNLENTILENLINNEPYFRKVIPHIKEEYFDDNVEKTLIKFILKFAEKHNKPPSQRILELLVKEFTGFSQDEFEQAETTVSALTGIETNTEWLIERTEKFAKDKSIYNAITQSVMIADGQDKNHNIEAIPSILSEALSVCFDTSVGHNYTLNASDRWEFYHEKLNRVPFGLDMFNKITNGGLPNKTITVFLAGCVHPDTKIKIRLKEKTVMSQEYLSELEIHIGDIPKYLNEYDVEVSSPDGFVNVSAFVDKGMWDEYILEVNGKTIRCNENHLFETSIGWKYVTEILFLYKNGMNIHVLTDDGLIEILSCYKTGMLIPIVDIQVDHDNHRYYTDGISSHNTGVGKSLFLCDFAANCMRQGKNVLYITLELAEERVSERIDCNLFDCSLKDLQRMSKKDFMSNIDRLNSKTFGELVVKEYPTGSASVAHFRTLLSELKTKKKFKPDIIFVDYINICASMRFKTGGSHNSYTIVKAITEELRALAIEENLPVVSATQSTRSGNGSSDLEIGDTSESIGLPQSVDALYGIIRTEELDKMGQLMIKQLKSRFSDITFNRKFLIGIDISKFKLFDVEESAQSNLSDRGKTDKDVPMFDKSKSKNNSFDDIDFD